MPICHITATSYGVTINPMPWLSSPGCRTVPSVFMTGSGLKLMSGDVSFSVSEPSASALESRRI